MGIVIRVLIATRLVRRTLLTVEAAMKIPIVPAVIAKTAFVAQAVTVVRWRQIAQVFIVQRQFATMLQHAQGLARMRRVSRINAERPLILLTIARVAWE